MSEPTGDIETTHITEPATTVSDGFEAGQIVIGKYKVVSLLGRGGIGSVYKVEQIFLSQFFALKTLNSQKASEQMIRRFQNEGRTASSLNHPNLVKVNDFGLLEGQQPYLVMDFVDGVTLSEHLKINGLMNLEQVVSLFAQVCLGLSYAHEQGVVHRDIKPSNIMISRTIPFGEEGFVKVVDFGIAKLAYAEDGNFQALTTTGEIFGSPLYMSPEQCSGSAVDHRADIYSLGCVLFEVLAGTTPFVGSNALATMMLHQSERVPTLKEASLGKDFPAELEVLVQKMLAKSPADRYQNLGVVANDLAQIYKGAPVLGLAAVQKKPAVIAAPITMSQTKFNLLLLAAAVCSALVFGSAGYFLGGSKSKEVLSAKTATAQPAVEEPEKTAEAPEKTAEEQAKEEKRLNARIDNELNSAINREEVDREKRRFTEPFYQTRALVDGLTAKNRPVALEALTKFEELREMAKKDKALSVEFLPKVEERITYSNIRAGNYLVAESRLDKTFAEATTAKEMAEVAGMYHVMAQQVMAEGDGTAAFQFFKKGSDAFLRASKVPGADPKFAMECKANAGNFLRCCSTLSYQFLKNAPQAVELGYAAKALLDDSGNNNLLADAYVSLGAALARDNQYEKAKEMLLKGEKFYIRADDPIGVKQHSMSCAYLELCNVEMHLDDIPAAIRAAQRAKACALRFKPKDEIQKQQMATHIVNIDNQIKALKNTKKPG